MKKDCIFILPPATLSTKDKSSLERITLNEYLKKYYDLISSSGVRPVFILESDLAHTGGFPIDMEEVTFVSLLNSSDLMFYENNCEKEYNSEKLNIIEIPKVNKYIKEAGEKYKATVVRNKEQFLIGRLDTLNKRVRHATTCIRERFPIVVDLSVRKNDTDKSFLGDGRFVVQCDISSRSEYIVYGGVELSSSDLVKILEVI